jgi:ribosomal protein S18 acetylase RimI-like enzyme
VTTNTSASAITIRAMRAEDWQQARCVRLAALADAPDAFGRTLEEELALSDADWQKRAAENAIGLKRSGFLAWSGDVPCGLAVGVLSEPAEAELQGMWVAQNIRRHGVGRALVQAVCAWARERGAKRISLKVTADNTAASGLYRANGFEPVASTTCGARQAAALRLEKKL